MDLYKALALVVNSGGTVIHRGWHLFQSQKGGHLLLHFDERADLVHDDEQSIDGLEDAVRAFMDRSGIKEN